MDVENVPSLKNLTIQFVVMSLMKALEKRMELLGELETDDSDQETIIDGMLENSDNTETEETETLKRGMLEETDNSENGKVDLSGENSLVLSYGDDKISCDLERHSGLESGNNFNGKGQIEGGTDKSDGSENKFAMDKQDGSEGVVNGQIHETVSSGDNGQDTDFAMDKKEESEPTENGQIQESVSSGDNGQDTDFAMDKKEESEPTENGQIQKSVSGGDNGQDTDFAMDKNKESEPTENGQIQESVSGGDNGQDTDFAMDKKEGSEPMENGQIRESVFGGYGDNGPDMNQLGCYLDTETPCTHGSEKHVQEKDYFDTFQARKYDDWSFVWNEQNIEDEVSLEAQSTDYFENISLSGFTDRKTDERIKIRKDDTLVYGNNL